MAKKSVIQRNIRRQVLCESYKERRAQLKAVLRDKSLSISDRFAAQMKFIKKMPKDSSEVRVRNRCILTGRPRGVYRSFGLCRIVLRDLCLFGQIPGVVKSSW